MLLFPYCVSFQIFYTQLILKLISSAYFSSGWLIYSCLFQLGILMSILSLTACLILKALSWPKRRHTHWMKQQAMSVFNHFPLFLHHSVREAWSSIPPFPLQQTLSLLQPKGQDPAAQRQLRRGQRGNRGEGKRRAARGESSRGRTEMDEQHSTGSIRHS